MTATTPCYRHPRGMWIASCQDCTSWHLAVAIGRRAQTAPRPTTAARAATGAPRDLRPVA
jgi:hypothetical protein